MRAEIVISAHGCYLECYHGMGVCEAEEFCLFFYRFAPQN